MGVLCLSVFCFALRYVLSSFALLGLSSWYLVVVERLFLAVPRGCLQFVIVVFPDHTHLLLLQSSLSIRKSWLLCFYCLTDVLLL